MGGKEQNSAIYISRIIPGGASFRQLFTIRILAHTWFVCIRQNSHSILRCRQTPFKVVHNEEIFHRLISICCLSGLAERQGGLRRGDQLLAVNGVSVEGENHERAVELLKQAQGTVTLVVRYAPHVLEQMEMRFDRQHHVK